ncbi:GspE/PulE family protein [Ferrovibrio sp.]|uniref:GspE/PulE family protein n=1 Tax=Ferrovibrio sp. TaxID=1917215 RepID=UPI003D0DB937
MNKPLVVHDLPPPSGRLETLLLERALLNPAALERASVVCQSSGTPLVTVLVRLGLVDEERLAATLAEAAGAELCPASALPDEPVGTDLLPQRFLQSIQALPLALAPDLAEVALVDPTDAEALAALRYRLRRPLRLSVLRAGDFERGFERLYGDGVQAALTRQQQEGEADDALQADDLERLRDQASDAPVIRLVNRWIERAAEAGASDIHIEPLDNSLRVRFRVDGVLREIEQAARTLHAAIVSRLKIMARLDIAERRLAQDGRITAVVRGREVDIRVSIVPTGSGESVVLRLLERAGMVMTFEALGFHQAVQAQFEALFRRPHGIVLVTGPTGSGKTTTLYAALLQLRQPGVKILTIEDPIEYRLEGVMQTQVKPQIGLSFANTLRAFLRHDPDIMMVGEIRDAETARIAAQAALTGHLVLSTLHTNDAPSGIARLLDMEIEPYLLNATINGIAAQRLVRKLCPHCRRECRPEAAIAADLRGLGLPERDWQPVGCVQCHGIGYAGRVVIAEIMAMSDQLRRLASERAGATRMREAALAGGMESMYQAGLRKVAEGITTSDEVLRVTAGG